MCGKAILPIIAAAICLVAGVALGGTKAGNPVPADGALSVTAPLLQWTKGDGAIFHNVYLGTTPDLTEANQVASRQPFEMYYHVAGFQAGVMYYWRVDEIEGSGAAITGDVWHFLTQALTAYYPTPADKAANASPTTTLSWMPGQGATKHHLYFGDSLDAVTQGAAAVDKGLLTETTFHPGPLENVKTYYWRVDETVTDGSVKAGPVWSFTTFLSIDDFESYTDEEGNRIYETWIDGWTNNTGSTVGHTEAPFAEHKTIHGGQQSMPLDYNNAVAPFYSEAERQFAPVQDWTAGGVTTLTLYFRGVSTNPSTQLYVALRDQAGRRGVVTYPTSAHVALPAWTRWEVPLSEFTTAGVNLAAVQTMYLGAGDRANPTAGGAGVLYFDDICVGGPGGPRIPILFAEDFEGLKLGPKVDEGEPGAKVWTKTPPPGWSIDDTGIPGVGNPAQDGVTEWAGWSFADRLWWVKTAGDQERSTFTKGIGTVAIADPDEWDDAAHADTAAAGWYKTFLSTRPIDVAAAPSRTLELTFDSSWRPEYDEDYHQTANLKVSFDGGPAVELFRWESNAGSSKYKPNATNETVKVPIDVPAGTKAMVLTFGLFDAGNDWWWAIDNILVTAQ